MVVRRFGQPELVRLPFSLLLLVKTEGRFSLDVANFNTL